MLTFPIVMFANWLLMTSLRSLTFTRYYSMYSTSRGKASAVWMLQVCWRKKAVRRSKMGARIIDINRNIISKQFT